MHNYSGVNVHRAAYGRELENIASCNQATRFLWSIITIVKHSATSSMARQRILE
jgi:hypothetical protein